MQNDVQYVKTCGIDFSFLECLYPPPKKYFPLTLAFISFVIKIGAWVISGHAYD